MLLTNLLLFVFFSILLAGSAVLCVRALAKISQFLGFSEFLVGFVIMGMFTTLPELFVGITSALTKTPALSLGNVVGSVIVNLTLICGIVILLAGKIDTKGAIKKDALRLFFIALVPIMLMVIGNGLSKLDGIILLLLFIYYIYSLYKERSSYRIVVRDHVTKPEAILYPVLFIISVVVLFLSSSGVVKYGKVLATDLGLPFIFIGLFFVAIGTSLPELAFGIMAARSRHAIMSLGDLIGAGVINSTLVLGVTAVIEPIIANFTLFLTSSLFMLLTVFLFGVFVESGKKLSWKEGIALIFLYVLFLIIELSVSGLIQR